MVFGLLLLASLGCSRRMCSPTSGPDSAEDAALTGPVRHYDVELMVTTEDDGVRVVGIETLALRPSGGRVALDALDMSGLEVACEPACAWAYDAKMLTLSWPEPAPIEATAIVRYQATPTGGVSSGDGAIWTSFHTWRWMPSTSDPSARATLALRVHTPAGQLAIATGDGPDRPGPDDVSRFPYPAYLYGFALGCFGLASRQAGDVRLDVWTPTACGAAERVTPELLPAASLVLDRTSAALERWSAAIGRPWSLEHYVTVFVPGKAAQELAGMAFMSSGSLETLLDDPDEDWLIVHELAHQEWGNRVTCATWGDFWLNEAVVVWWVGEDKRIRGDEEGYARELRLWAERRERALGEGADPRVRRPGVDHEDAGGSLVYHAGALIIAQLVEMVGTKAFLEALGGWVSAAGEHDGWSLQTSNFLDALELPDAQRRGVEATLAGSGR
ncbi:MAG: hypothetical protein AUK47_05085 [Deltaproteobacteria bacterium CG2_30_63_29]|nr:MAG: hypothetical protein AUK47_05085 [Deltaproteobacteria bacterium CG2_30_63_29]